jgi:hypothetical protein
MCRQSSIYLRLSREYRSWGELKGASHLVIIGTVGAQSSFKDNHGFPWTNSMIHVQRVIVDRQQSSPKEVTMSQYGVIGDEGVTVKGFPVLQTGSTYLLFLTPTTLADGFYYPIGQFQGAFTVGTDGLVNSMAMESGAVGLPVNNRPLDEVIADVTAAPDVDVTL